MPDPTQPMNEEELRAKIKKVGSFKYGARHTVMPDSCVDSLLELFMEERNAAIREARIDKPSIHVFDTWLSIDMGAEIRFEPAGMWGQRVWQNGGTYVCSGKEVNEDKTSITDHVNYRFTKIGDASYGTGGYKDVFIRGKDIKKWIEDGASGDLENYQGWFTLQSQPNAKEGE